VDLFCKGGSALLPAQAAVGMMYANGKGVQQNYAEAGNWWKKAAESKHALSAANAARAPKATPEIPAGAYLTKQ
jgi:TPR repeat protein